MVERTKISQRTIEELKYYVYALKDPRNGEIFYIGKGKGQRIFDHEAEALVHDRDDTEKIERIKSIKKAGKHVIKLVVRHGLKTEQEAYNIEAALIDILGDQLTNNSGGHDSDDYGLMTIKEIEIKYQAKTAKFTEPALLININDKYIKAKDDPEKLYNATRMHWRVNQKRASKIRIACAVYRGIIREVYAVESWGKSTKIKGRKYFIGKVAPSAIREKYLDTSVAQYWGKGSQNPIRYVEI